MFWGHMFSEKAFQVDGVMVLAGASYKFGLGKGKVLLRLQ